MKPVFGIVTVKRVKSAQWVLSTTKLEIGVKLVRKDAPNALADGGVTLARTDGPNSTTNVNVSVRSSMTMEPVSLLLAKMAITVMENSVRSAMLAALLVTTRALVKTTRSAPMEATCLMKVFACPVPPANTSMEADVPPVETTVPSVMLTTVLAILALKLTSSMPPLPNANVSPEKSKLCQDVKPL